MKHTMKIVAAVGLSLPIVFGSSASAVTVDDPIYNVAGNAMVQLEESTGHADGRVENE